MSNDRVIVAGAGPVGLTVALILAKHGVPVTVLEAEQGIVPSPRAIVYHPPTLEALGQVGVMEDLQAVGVLKQEFEYRDISRAVLAKIDYKPLAGKTKYPFNLHLGQDRLAEVILSHLQRLPAAEVLWGHRVKGVEQTDDDVTAIAAVGDEDVKISGRWLVGADGAGSGTRRAVGLEFQGHTWPVRFVATNVLHNFELDGYGRGNFVIDPHHWAIIVILGRGDLWRLTFGESNELPLETLKDRIAAKYRHFTDADIVDRITAYSPYRVHERAAERFRVGRVLLAGDAAHANNPCGGFGLTSGLLDAAALGYPLAAVFHGKQDTTILDRYANERRRIFLEKTSPAASENLRRFEERDPERRRADMERLRRLNEDAVFNLQAALFTFSLASPELSSPALLS